MGHSFQRVLILGPPDLDPKYSIYVYIYIYNLLIYNTYIDIYLQFIFTTSYDSISMETPNYTHIHTHTPQTNTHRYWCHDLWCQDNLFFYNIFLFDFFLLPWRLKLHLKHYLVHSPFFRIPLYSFSSNSSVCYICSNLFLILLYLFF